VSFALCHVERIEGPRAFDAKFSTIFAISLLNRLHGPVALSVVIPHIPKEFLVLHGNSLAKSFLVRHEYGDTGNFVYPNFILIPRQNPTKMSLPR
jgi:hypothetical protein